MAIGAVQRWRATVRSWPQRPPGGSCSTTPVFAGARGAICGQIMALDVHSSHPTRRSDDGQTILKAASERWRLGPDLGKLVELRGFEPLTSCMPWEMRKFNCRQMPAAGDQCQSNRASHADDHGQMTVKTILNSDGSHPGCTQWMVPRQVHEDLEYSDFPRTGASVRAKSSSGPRRRPASRTDMPHATSSAAISWPLLPVARAAA
jgi:hypothetical protein